MSSIIKSIALDEKSAEIARSLPNFSHFVRECLFRHAATLHAECDRPKDWAGTKRCNPSNQPTCWSCWPNGAPPLTAIKQFRQDGLSVNFLDQRARENNSRLIDLVAMERKVPKSRSDPPLKASLWQKLLRKLK
jgi:hypothetical protein